MSDNVVSVEWFERGRKHRYGRANPERFDEPVWEWMERENVSYFDLNERFGIPWDFADERIEADWWFRRLSEARVDIGDGRSLWIGGMADTYGVDAVYYNDVRLYHSDEAEARRLIAIYGYPRDVFPGICGASATFVGEYVYVIGGVEEGPRRPGRGWGCVHLWGSRGGAR